jgi:hypothetical protein
MAGFFLMLGEGQGEVKPHSRPKNPPWIAPEALEKSRARLRCAWGALGDSHRVSRPQANQKIR